MRTYQRARVSGGVYFFTLVLADRKGNDLLVHHIDPLREAFRTTMKNHPFALEAICILPDHLHCLWRLPDGDDDFPMRWRLIKGGFSRSLPKGERVSRSRLRKGERGIWQRRYWEHVIRGPDDYRRHMDYIHYNPVRHGYVERVIDWRYSSFPRMVEAGVYAEDWSAPLEIMEADYE